MADSSSDKASVRETSMEPADGSSGVNDTENTSVDDAELCSLSGRESSVEPSLLDAVSLCSDHSGKPADSFSARSVSEKHCMHVHMYNISCILITTSST